MPIVNLTVEQLLEALRQLSPEEMKHVDEELHQRLISESEEDTHRALVAAAIEATDWWDDEGDKAWDKWQP
jgi:hypothetical protein